MNKKDSFQLPFQYANGKEIALVIIGVIFSMINGGCFAFLPKYLGVFLETLVGVAKNRGIKKMLNIDDDDTILQMIKVMGAKDKSEIDSFQRNHPEIDFSAIKAKLQSNQNGNSQQMNFRPMDSLMDTFVENIYRFIVIAAVSFITGYIAYVTLIRVSNIISTRIRSKIYPHVLRQNIEEDNKNKIEELSSNVNKDAVLIGESRGTSIGIFFKNITSFICCYTLAYKTKWKLALILLSLIAASVFIIVAIYAITNYIDKWSNNELNYIFSFVKETLSNLNGTFSSNLDQSKIYTFVGKLKLIKNYEIIKFSIKGILVGCIFTSAFTLLGVFFRNVYYFINDGSMQRGDIVRVLLSKVYGTFMLVSGLRSLKNIVKSKESILKLNKLIENSSKNESKECDLKELQLQGEIQFDHVSYEYLKDNGNSEYLNDASFTMNQNQTTALVGDKKSGKSIPLKLLERFINKKSGQILIDGNDIEKYNDTWLHSQMGLISKDPFIFETTVAKNISIMKNDASQEEIEKVSKLVNIHNFIMTLPEGYETVIEMDKLNYEQKQRICIARVLITNPKIILIEDLDSVSSLKNTTLYNYISKNSTIILISNNLSVLSQVDNIIVMEDGNVIETGNHKELIQKNGTYCRLIENHEIKSEEEECDIIDASREIIQEVETKEMKDSISMLKILKRFFSYNKYYTFANVIGWIGNILGGFNLPILCLLITSYLTGTDTNKNISKFVYLGLVNLAAYSLQFIGHSLSGENLTKFLRTKIFYSSVKQDPKEDINSYSSHVNNLIKDASEVQGISRSIGFLLEITAALCSGLTIIFINSWVVGVCIIALIILIIASNVIKSIKSDKSNSPIPISKSSSDIVNESMKRLNSVKAFNLEEYYEQLYNEQLTKENKRSIILSDSFKAALKGCMSFLLIPVIFTAFTFSVKGDVIVPDKLIKLLLSAMFTSISVAKAGLFKPNTNKAVDIFKNIIIFIDYGIKPIECVNIFINSF